MLVLFRLGCYHPYNSSILFNCDVCTDDLETTLEQKQSDSSIHPVVYISRVAFEDGQNWTPMEFEDDSFVWSTRHFRSYLIITYIVPRSPLTKSASNKSARQVNLMYVYKTPSGIYLGLKFLRRVPARGLNDTNANFLSRLPNILPKRIQIALATSTNVVNLHFPTDLGLRSEQLTIFLSLGGYL